MPGTKSSRKLSNNAFNAAEQANNPGGANVYATLADLFQQDGLISGSAVWSGSGFIYDVTNLVYRIGGVIYTAAATQVTLTAADPTNGRIDRIIADTTGTVSVKTGVASPAPVAPALDVDEVLVAEVIVPAGATAPIITLESIYDENAGSPTEWVGTSDDGNVTFASVADPNTGTTSIETTLPLGSNKYIQLAKGSPYTIASGTLNFYIKAKQAMSTPSGQLNIGFYVAGSLVGNSVYIGGSTTNIYGFDPTNTSTYQLVSIPITAFGVLPTTVDAIRFFKGPGSTTAEFFLDSIEIQEGATAPPVTSPGVGGSGTLDYVPKWTPDGDTLGDSQIRDDGDTVAVNGAPTTDYQFLVFNDTDDRYAIAGIAQANSISNIGIFGGASLGPSNIGVYGLADGGTSGTATGILGVANLLIGTFPSAVAVGGSFSAGVDGVPGDVYGLRTAVAGSNPNNNIALYAQANNPGAGSNWAAQFVDGTEGAGKVWTSDALGRGSWQTPSGGGSGTWQTPDFTLGDAVGNGATAALAVGAGYYYNFDATSDDEIVINVGLDNNGLSYDGSSLRLDIHNMLVGTPGAGDDVLWELDYAFIDVGDNAYTKVDGTPTNLVDVTGRTSQIMYIDSITIPAGTAGSHILQLTLRRNSQGGGSDTFAGSVEVYALDLVKL